MKKLLLIALLLSSGIPAYSATTEQITNALAKYCVPKPYDSVLGNFVCGNTPFEGKYIPNQSCGCHSDDTTYMQYDPILRRCKVVCPKGTKTVEVSDCPKGYKKHIIKRKD